MAGPGTVEPLDYRSYKNLPASAAVRHSRFRLLERRNTNSVPIGKIVRSCAYSMSRCLLYYPPFTRKMCRLESRQVTPRVLAGPGSSPRFEPGAL